MQDEKRRRSMANSGQLPLVSKTGNDAPIDKFLDDILGEQTGKQRLYFHCVNPVVLRTFSTWVRNSAVYLSYIAPDNFAQR